MRLATFDCGRCRITNIAPGFRFDQGDSSTLGYKIMQAGAILGAYFASL
jgi:hypothetical protein